MEWEQANVLYQNTTMKILAEPSTTSIKMIKPSNRAVIMHTACKQVMCFFFMIGTLN